MPGALAVPQAVLEAVQPGEVLVGDAAGQPAGQAVHREAQVAEAVVGGADPLPVELRGQPVPLGGRPVAAAQVGLDAGHRGGQAGELGGRVGLVLLVRAASSARVTGLTATEPVLPVAAAPLTWTGCELATGWLPIRHRKV